MDDRIGALLQSGLLDIGLPMLLVLAGVALVVMEALAPGAHFIVIGIAVLAAGLVGLIASQIPVLNILAGPIALAAMVFLFGAIAFYAYKEFDFYGGKGQEQTSDSDSLKGTTGRVTERVTETDGQVKLEDGGFNPYYQARSFDGDIEEGEEVVVVDPGGGNVVTVMSIDQSGIGEDEIDRELKRAREAADEGDGEDEAEAELESDTETN